MTDPAVIFQDVAFSYDRATRPLIDGVSVHFPMGWTGIVGANGVGKSTILKLATGALAPGQGRVVIPGAAIYCRQRTDHPPDGLGDLLRATDGDALRLMGRLGLGEDWPARWATLSHGERKRAQIAVALWRHPQILAIDEPTNHLDTAAQDMLFDALAAFKGIGLLVSHDRRLLDDLCRQCLFVDPPDAVLRPGSYTHGSRQKRIDEMSLHQQRLKAKKDFSRLKREADKRRDAASQANRRRSKRGLAPGDHDAREKIDAARLSGKDGSAGRKLNQLKGRLSRARLKMDGIKVRKSNTMGIWMPGAISPRDTLFHLSSGTLSLGGNRQLTFPDLSMKPADRIALTGANGCGKSTLVDWIMRSHHLGPNEVTYVPQEIDLHTSQAVVNRARSLSHDKLGHLMTIVSRLGSRPRRLLESVAPSPGEIRKLLLAMGIADTPHLIVMDEPTNHLDLPSIECLETALSDCPCGLLLVSHDQRFLDALTRRRWHIVERSPMNDQFVLERT